MWFSSFFGSDVSFKCLPQSGIFRHPLVKVRYTLQSLNFSECRSILSCLISTRVPAAAAGSPPNPPPPPQTLPASSLRQWLELQLSTLCDITSHTHASTYRDYFGNFLPDKLLINSKKSHLQASPVMTLKVHFKNFKVILLQSFKTCKNSSFKVP